MGVRRNDMWRKYNWEWGHQCWRLWEDILYPAKSKLWWMWTLFLQTLHNKQEKQTNVVAFWTSITWKKKYLVPKGKVYKFFWTMLFHRGVIFLDERYRERKLNVLQLDPRFTNVASHRRDILPECVVNLVRVWFPNPKNIPYMGHRWQWLCYFCFN